jgi:lysophospholipase L1-like esterase
MLGLALVAVAALELTTRLEDRVRFGTPLSAGYTDQAQLIVRDRDGVHGRPHARFRKFALNNYGFRGPDITPLPAPGVRRVLVVGASETFGLGESPGREYPRQLADSLAALAAGRFEVVNAAMPGMSLPTLVQDVRLRLGRLGASHVVAYPTPVQYLMDALPQPARPDSSVVAVPEPSPWELRMTPRLYEQAKLLLPGPVATRLRARDIERVVAAKPAGWVFDSVPLERAEAYERDLRAFVGAVRAAGAEPLLVAHVNVFADGEPRDELLLTAWRRFYPRATGEVIIAFDRLLRGVTCRVAADSGVAFVDPAPRLPSPRHRWFADYAHFSDAGAAQVAGAVAGALLAPGGAAPGEAACATR